MYTSFLRLILNFALILNETHICTFVLIGGVTVGLGRYTDASRFFNLRYEDRYMSFRIDTRCQINSGEKKFFV